MDDSSSAGTPPHGVPPDTGAIAALAERAMAILPPRLARHMEGVGLVIEERADAETLRGLGIDSAWDLTGLYRGVPLPERGHMDIARQPDMIFLYREAILLEWIETGEDLYCLVRNVVIHEIAHHFGFSDAEIAALEAEKE